MLCEMCGKEHDGSYGSGRFCSIRCKQKYVSTKNCSEFRCKFCGKKFLKSTSLGCHMILCSKNSRSKNVKDKIRKTVEKSRNRCNPIIRRQIKCSVCGNVFIVNVRASQYKKGKYRKTCSVRCAHHRNITDKMKECIRNSLLRKHERCENHIDRYRSCIVCGKKFIKNSLRSGLWKSERFCSKICAKKHKRGILSEVTRRRCELGEFGGINNDTYKKHKHGWYDGIYCGSSWELAFVLYQKDLGKQVCRCNKVFQYSYNGKLFKYYPDFEIGSDIYEIKGFENLKSKAKHEQFPNIVWIGKKEMEPILKYVICKYGKNYAEMLSDKKQ